MKYLYLLGLLLLSGCAANSVFHPYPEQMDDARLAIISGKYQLSLSQLEQQRTSADGLLYLMERGRLAQLAGQPLVSLHDFAEVLTKFEQQDAAARVQVGRFLSQTGSLLTNDNAIPYRGASYERLLVHCHQVFNYLSLKQPESALVELRRAYEQQKHALSLHQDELEQAKQQVRAYGSEAAINSALSRWQTPSSIAASFNSGYAYVLSALLYEALGQNNDALIDYQKAAELYPGNQQLHQDVLRLANLLSRRDLVDAAQATPVQLRPRANQGRLVVLVEQGLVPEKLSMSLPFFFDGGLQQLTLPIYPEGRPLPEPAVVHLANWHQRTELIDNIQGLAQQHLAEQIPKILVRQLARMYSKGSLQHQMAKNRSIAGGILGLLYTVVSEQADLRSWLTLPAAVFYAASYQPIGPQRLLIDYAGQQWPIQFHIQAGRTSVLRVILVKQRIQTQMFLL